MIRHALMSLKGCVQGDSVGNYNKYDISFYLITFDTINYDN